MASWQQLIYINCQSQANRTNIFNGVELRGYADYDFSLFRMTKHIISTQQQALLSIRMQYPYLFKKRRIKQIQKLDYITTLKQQLKYCGIQIIAKDHYKLNTHFRIGTLRNHKTLSRDGNSYITAFQDNDFHYYIYFVYS